VPALRQMR